MQSKTTFFYLLFICAFVAMAMAAAVPLSEKKALRQLVIKRGGGPTPVARAEASWPSKPYKRAGPSPYPYKA